MSNNCQVAADERRYLQQQDEQEQRQIAIEEKSLEIFEDLQRAIQNPHHGSSSPFKTQIEVSDIDLSVLKRLWESSGQTLDAVVQQMAIEQLGLS